jgi:hypothetical protein
VPAYSGLHRNDTVGLGLEIRKPCPSLPTITDQVDKRSLLITVLLISTGFDNVKITLVAKHPGATISG